MLRTQCALHGHCDPSAGASHRSQPPRQQVWQPPWQKPWRWDVLPVSLTVCGDLRCEGRGLKWGMGEWARHVPPVTLFLSPDRQMVSSNASLPSSCLTCTQPRTARRLGEGSPESWRETEKTASHCRGSGKQKGSLYPKVTVPRTRILWDCRSVRRV